MKLKPVRRKDREMDAAEAQGLLTNGGYGVLSTVSEDGQPYGVPLSYVYRDGAIYFHCAPGGHKIENMKANPRVSFCVVGETEVLPERFAMAYESVVAFGTASEVEGSERRNALLWLLEKYSPAFVEEGKRYIDQQDKVTKVVKIKVEHLSGKARR